ncbi:MAG: hypothetical protein O3B24_00870 [Verrucomicrobia bacterium]|nr:hypothetical protein [Verrucomicrobiota bacterium]
MRQASRLFRWGSMGVAGVGDHGFFSGTNFLLTMLLCRWLPPDAYGVFAVAFSIHFLLFAVHNALVLEPAIVVGPGSYGNRMREYARRLFQTTWMIGGAFTAVLLLAAAALHRYNAQLALSCAALAVVEPCILFVWVARRLSYVQSRPHLALVASAVYAAILLTGLVYMRAWGLVSAHGAFLLLGVASLLAGLLLQHRLTARTEGTSATEGVIHIRTLWAEHFGFGRWFLAGHGLAWLSSAAYIPLLGYMGGLAESGTLRALENLFLPVQQVMTMGGSLAVPWMTRRLAVDPPTRLRRTTLRLAGVALLLSLGYSLLVLMGGRALLTFVYPNACYAASAFLLPWFTMEVIARSIGDTGLGTALRALRRPDILFRATLAAGLFTVSAGVLLTYSYGVAGATAARAASALVYLLWLLPPTLRLLRGTIRPT